VCVCVCVSSAQKQLLQPTVLVCNIICSLPPPAHLPLRCTCTSIISHSSNLPVYAAGSNVNLDFWFETLLHVWMGITLSSLHHHILSAAGGSKDKGVHASNTEQAKQEAKGACVRACVCVCVCTRVCAHMCVYAG